MVYTGPVTDTNMPEFNYKRDGRAPIYDELPKRKLLLLLLLFFIRTQGTRTNSILQINKEIIVKINYTKILN